MVYMTTLPGGWIADRLIGQRRAVLYGGIIIASGHFSMAFPSLTTFYLGLFLIVIGTGLLKGNVSVIVGQLYAPDDMRRDAGFSIFYMGINLGAFIAPLVCGYLGQHVDWHIGFAAAGVGMAARRHPVPARRASISATPACIRRRRRRPRRPRSCSRARSLWGAARCSCWSSCSASAPTPASLPITAIAGRRRRRLLPADR